MGKLMVADGLGVTVLPDYSVQGDPLCRAGLVVVRPISDDDTEVRLLLLARDAAASPALRALQAELVGQARDVARTAGGEVTPSPVR